MPIDLACNACGKQYRVPEKFAGTRIPCKQCGEDIYVSDGDDYGSAARGNSRRPVKKGKSRRNAGMPWMIAGGALGAVGLIVGVVAVVMSMRPAAPTIPGTQVAGTFHPAAAGATPVAGGTATPAAGGTAPSDSVTKVPATPPPAQKSNAEYDKNLARQAMERAYKGIVGRFTQAKTAIVIINGVEGIESEADHYLERKLFKAAYAEYEAGQRSAQQQTESNRKQAEQQALADQQSQWGGYGPSTVWYRYKPVFSDVPYPEVKGGASGNGQFVYYIGPLTDLNQLGSSLGVGSVAAVDSGKRTVTINASLPVPIPDIDVEEMTIQHGRESVASIIVEGAQGDPDRVNYYLETEVKSLGGEDARLIMVGPRQIQPGKLQFWVAPVKNVNDLAARVSFGSITDLDQQKLIVTVAAKIPDDLPPRPSARELAEIERKRREGDLNPNDGESEIEWAIRILKKPDNERQVITKVLSRLASMDVDEEHKDRVTAVLASSLDDDSFFWYHREYTPALRVWFDPRIGKRLNALLQSNRSIHYGDDILDILSEHPSEDSAKGIASMMDNFHFSKKASLAMREMGTHAEDVLLKHITHQDPKVRYEIYDILAEQGTKKSVGKLKGNITKERDQEMKQFLKDIVERLQTRLKDGTEDSGDK